MQAGALISLLQDYIETSNYEKLEKFLIGVPVSKLSVPTSDALLSDLLETCLTIDNRKAAKIIYDYWIMGNPEESLRSLLSHMFTQNRFSDNILRFMLLVIPEDATAEWLFDQLIKRDDSIETVNGLQRLFDIFNITDYNRLVGFRNKIEAMEIDEDLPFPRMKLVINRLIEEHSEPVAKPDHVITPEFGLVDSDDMENMEVSIIGKISAIPLEEKVELFFASLDESKIEIVDQNKVKDEVRKRLVAMTEQEQIDTLYPLVAEFNYKQLMDNNELFRRFGPSHTHRGMILEDDADALPCDRYGGCRMLLCVCHETVNEDEELEYTLDIINEPTETNWFTGYCGAPSCHRKIEKECYAVRRPLESGGWLGCYCSWNHVREDVPTTDDSVYEVVFGLIDKFQKQVEKRKIYDRDYTDLDIKSQLQR